LSENSLGRRFGTTGAIRQVVRRYAPLWPYLNWGLFALGAAYCIAAQLGLAGYPAGPDGIVAGDAVNYYYGTPYSDEHYRYSPSFYWLTLPLRALPWELFISLWTAAHLAVLAWLGPWTILLAFDDVIRGNVTTFLALGVVLAVRGHTWSWSWTLLTKVTPGIGILVHVGRREWRAVVVAFGSTALVIALTWPLGLWPEWFVSLAAAPEGYQTIDVLAPLPVRLVIGSILCLLAARWLWLLPEGMIIAMPGLWPSSFALLAALPRLLAQADGRWR
jgi:hypothetical protein